MTISSKKGLKMSSDQVNLLEMQDILDDASSSDFSEEDEFGRSTNKSHFEIKLNQLDAQPLRKSEQARYDSKIEQITEQTLEDAISPPAKHTQLSVIPE